MLDRLEAERRESAEMALAVQEGERQRIARELHDEVGQTLTAMLLQIESFYADAPAELRGHLDELRETARSGAEDVRRIAQRLRPEALEELGLQSALVALSDRFAEQTGVRVARRIDTGLAAERPGRAGRLPRGPGGADQRRAPRARDAGRDRAARATTTGPSCCACATTAAGSTSRDNRSSYGVRGMRERAMLIGATIRDRVRPTRRHDDRAAPAAERKR